MEYSSFLGSDNSIMEFYYSFTEVESDAESNRIFPDGIFFKYLVEIDAMKSWSIILYPDDNVWLSYCYIEMYLWVLWMSKFYSISKEICEYLDELGFVYIYEDFLFWDWFCIDAMMVDSFLDMVLW